MEGTIQVSSFLEKLQAHFPYLHALTRDTCSITRMSASNKINVVPPEAWAEIDCAEYAPDNCNASLCHRNYLFYRNTKPYFFAWVAPLFLRAPILFEFWKGPHVMAKFQTLSSRPDAPALPDDVAYEAHNLDAAPVVA